MPNNRPWLEVGGEPHLQMRKTGVYVVYHGEDELNCGFEVQPGQGFTHTRMHAVELV